MVNACGVKKRPSGVRSIVLWTVICYDGTSLINRLVLGKGESV